MSSEPSDPKCSGSGAIAEGGALPIAKRALCAIASGTALRAIAFMRARYAIAPGGHSVPSRQLSFIPKTNLLCPVSLVKSNPITATISPRVATTPEFRLTRLECRQVFLYAIKKAQEKYGFKLYALCIMSNHVHYLLEPKQPEDLPKIMHWQPLWGSQKSKVKSQKLKVKNKYFKTIVR
jgi:hypothetical protein